MKKVYKFPFVIADEVEIMMPKDAKVLTVQMRCGEPCIYAAIDPDIHIGIVRKFRIAGTGHPIEDEIIDGYIGTFQCADGMLVFHVFEIKSNAISQ